MIDVPIAAPGSYQLFMPDPEMMDRLTPSSAGKPEIIPEARSTSRSSRSESKKRVVIADPPVSGSQSPPRSPRSKSNTSRIVSYQRPRSRSRNSKLASATHRVNTSLSERKAMDDLNASMRAANELLDRRRAAGSSGAYTGSISTHSSYSSGSSSRYVEPSYTAPTYSSSYERGRTTTRSYHQQPIASTMASSSYRSNTTSSTTEATATSGSLWGLLDMAQSWIMSHKSRRDRSEDKAKFLLRKSRQL